MPRRPQHGPLENQLRKKLQARERSRRYRASHPDKIRAANRAQRARGRRDGHDPNYERERRQEKYFRLHAGTGGTTLNDPRLFWMDQHGHIHAEDHRSPEEVIAEWQSSHQSPAAS
jgi:hypothetical protein